MHRFPGMYIPPLDDLFALGAKGLLKDARGGRADADDGVKANPTPVAIDAAD